MIEPEEWEERLRAAVEETLRRRAAKRAIRQKLDASRKAGLVVRHRTKLARVRQEETMADTPPCCEGLDEPCPQHAQAARELRYQGLRNRSGSGSRVIGDSGRAKPAKPEETT